MKRVPYGTKLAIIKCFCTVGIHIYEVIQYIEHGTCQNVPLRNWLFMYTDELSLFDKGKLVFKL